MSRKGCSAGLVCVPLVALRALSVTDALGVWEQGPPGSGLANLRRAATPIFVVPDGRQALPASWSMHTLGPRWLCCDRTFEMILCRPPSRVVKLPSRNEASSVF